MAMGSGPARSATKALVVVASLALLSGCGQSPQAAHLGSRTKAPATRSTTKQPLATARVGDPAWTTYDGSASRWGSFPEHEVTGLRPAWTTPALDGAVYAQPLWRGGTAYVATENDTVYALSLATGRTIWRRHLGTPVPLRDLPCGDIDPLGITGTPVIAGGRLYVAAEVQPAQQRLYALDLRTGAVVGSYGLDLPGTHAYAQQQRGALTYLDGTVYVPLGGLYGDCGPYVGQVVAVRPGKGATTYRVPTARGGAIWATAGLSVGSDGNLYAATGNSASDGSWDGGDSILRLSPSLKLLGYFAPRDFARLNLLDLDLGSTAPLPLPGGLLFQIGKEGVGYLLKADDLGGVGHAVASGGVCSGAYGGDAYNGRLVYVPCTDGLVALRVGTRSFSVAFRAGGFDAGPPVVGGGAVFTVDEGSGRLDVLSAATGHLLAQVALGVVPHFDSPALAPGLVLVASGHEVHAFSLE